MGESCEKDILQWWVVAQIARKNVTKSGGRSLGFNHTYLTPYFHIQVLDSGLKVHVPDISFNRRRFARNIRVQLS